MLRNYNTFIICISLYVLLTSCNNKFSSEDFTAYFGGEIVNPTSKFVLFCKDSEVLDTIYLDKENRFFIKFDSLAPGLYSFKNEPEYQYVYFDKNDSIMVRVNTQEFDESVVFCGRGEAKNNFLMELYLKNDKDKNMMYETYDLDSPEFNNSIDQSYNNRKDYYLKQKEKIDWTEDFDFYAQASLNFYHYSKKENYPLIHKLRTGKDVSKNLSKDYYSYRNSINFNDPKLINYSPFVRYLTNMMNNIAFENNFENAANEEKSLELNIKKLQIADSIFTNQKLKNVVLNNIAFVYLLEDQDIENNKKFFNIFSQLSTDNSNKNEINKIKKSIQGLKKNNILPIIEVYDTNENLINSSEIITQNSILFFCTKNLESHFYAVHKKAIELKDKYPNYDFISICLDDSHDKWIKILSMIDHGKTKMYRVKDFEDVKEKWVVNKIHRTIIVNDKNQIINAFTNIYDLNFIDNL